MIRKISILVLALTLSLAGALAMGLLSDRWLARSESGTPANASESDRCQAVEVDGLCFETVIADGFKYVDRRFVSIQEKHVFSIPDKPDGKTIAFMGFRITNNTKKPVRIAVPASFKPILAGPNGEIEGVVTSNIPASLFPEDIQPLLTLSGESAYFLTAAGFQWNQENLTMSFGSGNRKYHNFNDLKPGSYQIKLTYDSVEEHFVAEPVDIPYTVVCDGPSDCQLVEQTDGSVQVLPRIPQAQPPLVCYSPSNCKYLLEQPSSASQPESHALPETAAVWKGIVTAQFETFQLIRD